MIFPLSALTFFLLYFIVYYTLYGFEIQSYSVVVVQMYASPKNLIYFRDKIIIEIFSLVVGT